MLYTSYICNEYMMWPQLLHFEFLSTTITLLMLAATVTKVDADAIALRD